MDLGLTVQSYFVSTELDRNSDGDLERDNDFIVRRARASLGANVSPWLEAFMQTDISNYSVKMLESWVRLKPHPFVNITIGRQDPPSDRQTPVSAGEVLKIEGPALSGKVLTQGNESSIGFTQGPRFVDSESGIDTGTKNPPDSGMTVYGNVSVKEIAHL